MTAYRLYPATNGPSAATPYSGPYEAGVGFLSTSGATWLQGYWWWVCNTGQQVTPVKFALWQVTSGIAGTVIPASIITSGTLTAGQWNFIPLATPVPLCQNTVYIAANGYTSTTGFPEVNNQFGTGQPLAGGITNGPLFAYGDTFPEPGSGPGQAQFGTASADPALVMPTSTFDNANFFMDVQITDTPPAGATYRLFPSLPTPLNQVQDTADNFTLGVEQALSATGLLENIWFYSPPGVTQLPTRCALWSVAGQAIVPGTDNQAPSWSGAAGSGWVSCAYAALAVAPGKYKATVFNGAGSPAVWNISYAHYWDAAGPGTNGISAGILSAPNNATADSPGQSSYHASSVFTYPDTNSGPFNYWVDAEFSAVSIVPVSGSDTGTWLDAGEQVTTGTVAIADADTGTFADGESVFRYWLPRLQPLTSAEPQERYRPVRSPDVTLENRSRFRPLRRGGSYGTGWR